MFQGLPQVCLFDLLLWVSLWASGYIFCLFCKGLLKPLQVPSVVTQKKSTLKCQFLTLSGAICSYTKKSNLKIILLKNVSVLNSCQVFWSDLRQMICRCTRFQKWESLSVALVFHTEMLCKLFLCWMGGITLREMVHKRWLHCLLFFNLLNVLESTLAHLDAAAPMCSSVTRIPHLWWLKTIIWRL